MVADQISMFRRLFTKAVQQGHSERRGESYSFQNVELLSDVRTRLEIYINSPLEED